MTSLQPETPAANTCERDEAGTAAAWQRVAEATRALAACPGLKEALAVLYRDDPLQAETGFRDRVHDACRSVLSGAYERPAGCGPSLEADGRTYRRTDATPGRAMTLFGPVGFQRSRYRPSGTGASLVPVESVLGLAEGGMTPAAAGLSVHLMSGLTARETEDTWERLCGKGPSAASLVRLSGEVGSCVEECGGELLRQLREPEEVPDGAVSLLVSLDGVMMHMNAETADGETREAGWREASCGVVALVDAEGAMLETRYFGRLPEGGKRTLKAQLKAEAMHWLDLRPDLRLVAVADGARDNWAFLESLTPDVTLLDFWHSAQHLKAAADAAFGPDTQAGTAWFEKWRSILRHEPDGAGRVIDALRYLQRKGRGREEIRKVLGYFRGNRGRMDYADAAAAGLPIGSGAVEAANKTLVTARMKRSGQRWGRDGGQGILTFRSLLKSGRFDRAWAALAPRLSRSGGWKPPQCANDNRPDAQVALAA